MRLLFSAVVVASVAFTGVAFADSNASLYGNTVVITAASGVTKARVNENNTYETTMPDGKTVKGTWAAAGDQTCYTQTEPAPAADAKPFCTKNEARNVGDTWESKGPDGSVVKFELQAGH